MKKTVIFAVMALCPLLTATVHAVSVEPGEPNAIFEKSEDVKYNITDSDGTNITVTVTDYFGTKTINAAAYPSSGTLSLGMFDTGWYEITMSQSGKNIYSGALSVVPDAEDEYTDTPFAVDVAANGVLKDINDAPDYARAAKLMGRSWARERFVWSENKDGSPNYGNFEKVVNAYAAENVNVLGMYATSPRRFASTADAMRGSLEDIYDYHYKTADKFRGRVQGWEIWNEPDHDNFAKVPADVYSSFYKAAALGVKDAVPEDKVVFGGLCQEPDATLFPDLMLRNGLMDYSDIFNIHRHLPAGYSSTQSFEPEFAKSYRELYKDARAAAPMWVTEAGLALPLWRLGGSVRKLQARYAVTSCAESMSAGTNKHFWFILPNYVEASNYQYGVVDDNGLTAPAYAAMAAMADIMGNVKYAGKTNISRVNGYVFTDGTRDILMAWASSSGTVSLTDTGSVSVYNMMGIKNNTSSSGGKISVSVGVDPIYIVFANGISDSDYTAESYPDEEYLPDLGTAEHIVLQADFGEKFLAAARDYGYWIRSGGTREVDITIYNFNDVSVSGTLSCSSDAFTAVIDGPETQIEPRGKKTIKAYLTPNGSHINETSYVRFEFVGSDGVSSSEAAVFIYDTAEGENRITVEGIMDGALYRTVESAVITFSSGAQNRTVRLDGTSQTVSGSAPITVDLSGLGEGVHTLSITATYSDRVVHRDISFTISGTDVLIEGETLEGFAGDSCKAYSYSEAREGACARFMSRDNKNFEFGVYASKEGTYDLIFNASKMDETVTSSPYILSVNDGETVPDKVSESNSFGVYSCSVSLKKGENKITFSPSAPRSKDNIYLIDLDYIELTRREDYESDTVVIEGEGSPELTVNGRVVSGDSVGYTVHTEMKSGSASGGAVMSVEPQSASRPLSITYTVNVEAAGEYNITLDRAVADNSYIAAGKLSAGGKTVSLYDKNTPDELSRVAEAGFTVPLYRYKLEGTFTLSKGENEISVIVDELPEGRIGVDDKAVFYLDRIVLEKVINTAEFSLSLESDTVGEGESIRAKILDGDGYPVSPQILGVHFTLSNVGYAVVEQDGWVTGEKSGRTDVCATFEYGNKKYELKAPITVEENEHGIIIDRANSTDTGAELVYTAFKTADIDEFSVIGARYEDDILKESRVQTAKLPPRWVSASVRFDFDSAGGSKGIFLWESFASQMPIVKRLDIK